jgi:hypothetical protein
MLRMPDADLEAAAQAAPRKGWRLRKSLHGPKYAWVSWGRPEEGLGTADLDVPAARYIALASPDRILALIDRCQRAETALPILRELALPSSMATDPDGECFFCGGDANEPEDHAGDCLVTLARAALEGGSDAKH